MWRISKKYYISQQHSANPVHCDFLKVLSQSKVRERRAGGTGGSGTSARRRRAFNEKSAQF